MLSKEQMESPPLTQEKTGYSAAAATPHPEATSEAIKILANGGNAIDAAIGALTILCVAAPMSVGLAGYGGSMIVYLAREGQIVAVDFDSRASLGYLPENFDGQRDRTGYRSISVPAVVAGMDLALSRYGTKSFRELSRRALAIADDGLVVDSELKRVFQELLGKADNISVKALFPDGVPDKGSLFIQKDLARVIRRLSEEGLASFYSGNIAQSIIKQVTEHGGFLTEEDFMRCRAAVVEPVCIGYRGYDICTPPPPSGGLTSLQTLKVLENFDLGSMQPWGADYFHHFAEAAKLCWQDRNAYLGDPDFVSIPVNELLSPATAADRAAKISRGEVFRPASTSPDSTPHTINVAAWDRLGNVVSLTATQGELFGSCVVVEGTGLVLGHGMSRFTNNPKSPNAPAPGKRMQHNMTPMIILKNGKPICALGMPGGTKIVNVTSQMVVSLTDFKKSSLESVTAPRIHTEGGEPLTVSNHIDTETITVLEGMGHSIEIAQAVGGPANIILQDNDFGCLKAVSGKGADAAAAF